MYKVNVDPYIKQFIRIYINNEEYNNLKEFSVEIAKQKHEEHFNIDDDVISKRFLTGLLGERALEIFLNLNIIDYTIGIAKDYNLPDISEFNIGIKSCEWGKYPIIFKQNEYGQVINLVKGQEVFICGYATVQMLQDFQNDSYVINKKLQARGTKTAYFNFADLISINLVKEAINEKLHCVSRF
jgi:hypothetical protein